MIKIKLISFLVKTLLVIGLLGLGVWYLSSSLGGSALTYTSADNFLNAIGVKNGDISTANGCFMCKYISDIFNLIGVASERFWNTIIDGIWILVVVGFGLFIIISAIQHFIAAAKEGAKLDNNEKKFEVESWANKIWRQGVRVLIVGAMMGVLGLGGSSALKVVSQVTITPVMYMGTQLSMMATGISDAAQCGTDEMMNIGGDQNALQPVLKPFLCIVGNVNSVMLAGAAGGFALMNYSWLGLGGGAFTWLAGLGLVLLFLIIGFDLVFQILSVVFKVVFVVIFLPIILAASAFEGVWSKASGLLSNSVNMLVSSAVRLVAITLKTVILYATVSYAGDAYFPGPIDGYSSILPPLLGQTVENPDTDTMFVMKAFAQCESVSLRDGQVDADTFKGCFEGYQNANPAAFEFLGDGWDFIVFMIALFFLYYYAISPRIDKMFGKDGNELFDIGTQVGDLIKTAGRAPLKITDTIAKKLGEK